MNRAAVPMPPLRLARVGGYGSSEHSRTVVQDHTESAQGVRMALLADRESRLLIDGKLVAGSGGHVPDRQPGHRGGARRRRRRDRRRHGPRRSRRPAARSTTPTGRPTPSCGCACIRQLQQAMRDHVEELRELTIAEVGRAADADVDGAARGPGRGPELLRRHRGVLPVDHRSRHRLADGHQDPPHHRARGRRRRRRHHAVELPAPDQPRQARARAGGGQHRGAQAGARHPVVRGGARRADRSSTPTSRPASSTSSPPATTASVRCCRRTRGSTWFRSPGRRTPAAR